MMRKAILAGMIVLVVAGCSKKKESEEPSIDITPVHRIGNIIMPLEVGDMWVYDIYGLDTAKNQLRPMMVDTLSVDTIYNRERWYHIGGLQGTEGSVINREDGFWFAFPGQPPFLFAKYPAELGDTFSGVIGNTTTLTTVEGTGVEVKTPAGTYFCYKYAQRVKPTNAITNYYFAPGVGLVKMEIMDRSGMHPVAVDVLRELNIEYNQQAGCAPAAIYERASGRFGRQWLVGSSKVSGVRGRHRGDIGKSLIGRKSHAKSDLYLGRRDHNRYTHLGLFRRQNDRIIDRHHAAAGNDDVSCRRRHRRGRGYSSSDRLFRGYDGIDLKQPDHIYR